MDESADDFRAKAKSLLANRPEALSKLLALSDESRRTRPVSRDSRSFNDTNQEFFDRAAEIVGPKAFEELFGFPPSQKANLVDERFVSPNPKTAPLAVSTKQLAAVLAGDHEMPIKQAENLLKDLVGLMTTHLKNGNRIRLNGLGVLVVRKRAARIGRNPATGELMKIKASKKVAFQVAKPLKQAI
jgi:DNA-binding protein HU-beta